MDRFAPALGPSFVHFLGRGCWTRPSLSTCGTTTVVSDRTMLNLLWHWGHFLPYLSRHRGTRSGLRCWVLRTSSCAHSHPLLYLPAVDREGVVAAGARLYIKMSRTHRTLETTMPPIDPPEDDFSVLADVALGRPPRTKGEVLDAASVRHTVSVEQGEGSTSYIPCRAVCTCGWKTSFGYSLSHAKQLGNGHLESTVLGTGGQTALPGVGLQYGTARVQRDAFAEGAASLLKLHAQIRDWYALYVKLESEGRTLPARSMRERMQTIGWHLQHIERLLGIAPLQ